MSVPRWPQIPSADEYGTDDTAAETTYNTNSNSDSPSRPWLLRYRQEPRVSLRGSRPFQTRAAHSPGSHWLSGCRSGYCCCYPAAVAVAVAAAAARRGIEDFRGIVRRIWRRHWASPARRVHRCRRVVCVAAPAIFLIDRVRYPRAPTIGLLKVLWHRRSVGRC